jgi:MoaA/NifB/PqqE/SkfB family radical SAM enzyme
MTYCINVYKSLRYANSGEVMYCCKSNQAFQDNQGTSINLQTHTIDEALHSKTAIEIRNALDNNIKHPNCKKCWEEEDAGIASKRILDNDRAKEYWGQDYLEDKKIEPNIVELNLGTTCNLKCRICGPWASSKWVKEHYDLRVPMKSKDAYKNYMTLVKHWGGNWREESNVWDNIEKELHQFKQLDFYGGEPFLVEKNWSLLRKMIEKGYAKDQILHFNTNVTIFNEEYANLLKEFKFVRISLSIDDIKERFEYQRHPSNWDEIYSNIKKVMQLQKENSNIEINVCSTISILNVYYIDELINFLVENNLSGYYINFLHFPDYFNMKNIKEDVKSKLTDYLTKKQNSFDNVYDKDSIQKIINYMNSEKANESLWDQFLYYTKKTDDYRKENFDKTFQEWSRMINENI